MGQKVNPIGLRLGINRTWDSRWYADGHEYGRLLHEDVAIRKHLYATLKQAGISKIVIERPHKKCRVTIHTARPGVVIGKKGADIEKLRKDISRITDSEVHLNIVEVRKPEIDATLVAEGVAQQLERRVAFRRAMKRAVQSAMRLGQKASGSTAAAAWAALKSPAANGTAKAVCRCTRCVQMSTTVRLKRAPHTASSGSRSGSSKVRFWNMIPWLRKNVQAMRRSRAVVVRKGAVRAVKLLPAERTQGSGL